MLNQPKIIRERKQSLHKFTETKQTRARSSTSLNKKHSTQPNSGSYLVGWGNIPFLEDNQKFKKIAKNCLKFSLGQKHIIYINHKYEAFGIGESKFGQLGYQEVEPSQKNIIIPILQQLMIQQVFTTPFCTFLLTNRDELYACGLNNRGQLGLGSTTPTTTPTRISSLSIISRRKSVSPQFRNTSKEKLNNKIQCYALAEKNQNRIDEIEFQRTEQEQSLLGQNEYIVSVVGGPYHTVALSSRGRVFYTGNIYKKSSIVADEYTPSFTELNLKKIGKVQMIKAGLTCIGLLNTQGNLFILGVLSENTICDEPYCVSISCIVDFSFSGNGNIYCVLNSGDVYFINGSKKSMKTNKIQQLRDIRQVSSGLDEILFTGNKNKCFSLVEMGKILSEIEQLNFHNLNVYSIKGSATFRVGFCERFAPQQKNSQHTQNENKKIQQLEKQNKMLKQLLKKESQNMKSTIQKQQNKFDIHSKTTLKPRLFDPSMEIPFSQIKLGKQISEGGYGIIYKALWRKTTVAVKIFKIDNSDNSIQDFISQCHAMEALRHPNIVMFLGACTKPPNFAIVLEYCEGGTLWSILQKSGELSWEQRRNFALDTAKGMNYLHDRPTPILHRDLKSLNLLLNENKRVKLADFGWTKGLQNYMTGKIGTYQWMAPEVVSSHQYTEKADVFSFGIILWQIASRQAPYRNVPGVQVAHDVLHKDLRPSIPKKTPQQFSWLMRRCWDKNPDKRPSFSEIINQLEVMKL